jgi:hypothetical protein
MVAEMRTPRVLVASSWPTSPTPSTMPISDDGEPKREVPTDSRPPNGIKIAYAGNATFIGERRHMTRSPRRSGEKMSSRTSRVMLSFLVFRGRAKDHRTARSTAALHHRGPASGERSTDVDH